MTRASRSIFSVLLDSSRAERLGSLALGFGRSATIWRNARDRVAYEAAEGHTFSLYLAGGEGTRRIDGPRVSGWPGAVSIMPQDHDSDWEITTPFRFAHVYVPAAEMGRAFAETTGRDARSLALQEVTFDPAPHLATPLRRIADATVAADPLAAEAALTELLARAFADPRNGGGRGVPVKGGLAPHLGRRIADYVDAHLDAPIRLADLAQLAGLSAFHFQRMFRTGHGVSPHTWLTHRRLARAKTMLCGTEPIAAIALACGFSGQSHLTRAFKAATGTTPAAYRSGHSPGLTARLAADAAPRR